MFSVSGCACSTTQSTTIKYYGASLEEPIEVYENVNITEFNEGVVKFRDQEGKKYRIYGNYVVEYKQDTN